MVSGEYNLSMAASIKKLLSYLQERFGIAPNIFEEYSIYSDKNGFYSSTTEVKEFNKLKFEKKGIKSATDYPNLLKLSTSGVQFFGRYATKNSVNLDEADAKKFINGEIFNCSDDSTIFSDGPVIVSYRGHPLGLAIFRNGKLKSQIPREKRIAKLIE